MKRGANGFTLIEMMITVAIIGILSALALPQYNDHITRGRLTEAFSGLGVVQPNAEQFWANNRSYVGFASLPPATANFTYALTSATTSAYTVTAMGVGKMAGFVFTVNQAGARATTSVPPGWTANDACWVDRKGGQCSE